MSQSFPNKVPKCRLAPALALLLFLISPAYSQFISVGVKGGIPITDAFSTSSTGFASATAYDRRYIVGPTAEVHLPFHLSFEVDALYRRNGFNIYTSGLNPSGPIGSATVSTTPVNDWQFPFLGKYEFASGPIRPFLDAGVSYRHVSTANSSIFRPSDPNTAGFTVGGGLGLKLSFIGISPEIRYTHWATAPFKNGPIIVSSTKNQADFLLGVTF